MAYTTEQMRNDLYHFGGYTADDLVDCSNREIEALWNERFNRQ